MCVVAQEMAVLYDEQPMCPAHGEDVPHQWAAEVKTLQRINECVQYTATHCNTLQHAATRCKICHGDDVPPQLAAETNTLQHMKG